jgi:hypothetical protein
MSTLYTRCEKCGGSGCAEWEDASGVPQGAPCEACKTEGFIPASAPSALIAERLSDALQEAVYMLGVLAPSKGSGGTIGFHPDSWQARKTMAIKERARAALAKAEGA